MMVDSIQDFDGPDRKVRLISVGGGHTESDMILYLPDDNILFSGDLIFNFCHPYVPDGNISHWQTWLAYMNSLDINTIMPGHGEIGNEGLIDEMQNYLQDLKKAAQLHINNNLSTEELDTIPVPEKYQEWLFGRFYGYNLKFAYESLKSGV